MHSKIILFHNVYFNKNPPKHIIKYLPPLHHEVFIKYTWLQNIVGMRTFFPTEPLETSPSHWISPFSLPFPKFLPSFSSQTEPVGKETGTPRNSYVHDTIAKIVHNELHLVHDICLWRVNRIKAVYPASRICPVYPAVFICLPFNGKVMVCFPAIGVIFYSSIVVAGPYVVHEQIIGWIP